MRVNPEYIRLNRYKSNTVEWTKKDISPKNVDFALDLSFEPFSRGEVLNEAAINASITMIILSSHGEHIFRSWLGSYLQSAPFELFSAPASRDLGDQLKKDVEAIEKRIKIINSEVWADPDTHTLTVNLTYAILPTGTIGMYSQKLAM